MNIRVLRAKTNLSQKEFGERICVKGQTVQKYESGERNIPESIQKLIQYEFAEYLPKEERLIATPVDSATPVNLDDLRRNEELKEENNRLLQRVQELENDKAELKQDKEMLQLHIKTLTGKPRGDQQTA